MKKLKKILCALALLTIAAGCANPQRVVGDEYIVVHTEYRYNKTYRTRYFVKAKPVNDKADALTFNGNYMLYFTNSRYSLGDTIRISKHADYLK